MAEKELRQEFEKWDNTAASIGCSPWKVWQAAYAAGERAKWISVEEKLPDEIVRVLIWFNEEDVDYGPHYTVRFGSIRFGHWRPEGGSGNFDEQVTHWMPLPEAPVPLSAQTEEIKK